MPLVALFNWRNRDPIIWLILQPRWNFTLYERKRLGALRTCHLLRQPRNRGLCLLIVSNIRISCYFLGAYIDTTLVTLRLLVRFNGDITGGCFFFNSYTFTSCNCINLLPGIIRYGSGLFDVVQWDFQLRSIFLNFPRKISC